MIKEIFKKKIPISANRFLNIKDIQGKKKSFKYINEKLCE